MKEVFMEFMVCLFMLAIIMIILSLVSLGRCSAVGKDLEYETEWHWMSGCIVTKPDGSKCLLNQLRDIQ